MPDTIEGRLAEIQMQAEDHHLVPAADALALVDALKAVLAPHGGGGPWVINGLLCPAHETCRYFSITDPEAAGIAFCPDCSADLYKSCAGCGGYTRYDSCLVRARIARELLRLDLPQEDATKEVEPRTVERSLVYCANGDYHDWQTDPEHRDEGLACTGCGVTETELEGAAR